MIESPLLRTGLPAIGAPMMNTRRERTAIAAMALVNGHPTHRLPNGLGYIAPDTGRVHGPHKGSGLTPIERAHEVQRYRNELCEVCGYDHPIGTPHESYDY